MTTETELLVLDGICKIYRTEFVQTHALREVSLRVSSGEFLAIAGPSGSGKSTLLNVLGLLEEFDSGRYTLAGNEVGALSDSEKAHLRRDNIGFIFQNFNLIPEFTVQQNVELPLRYRGISKQQCREHSEAILKRLGLAARARHLPSQLSGGQQQRVAIARALICEPKLILADEPVGNLDSETGAEIVQLLHDIHCEGGTIVMVTHDAQCAARASRRVHVIDGRIALEST